MTQEPIIDKLERLERAADWVRKRLDEHDAHPVGRSEPNVVLMHAPHVRTIVDALPSLLSQLREAQERADEAEGRAHRCPGRRDRE